MATLVVLALFANELLPSSGPPAIVEARRHVDEGDRLMREGNTNSALREFEAAFARDPNPLYKFYVAHALKSLGRLDDALVAARAARNVAQESADCAVIDELVAEIQALQQTRGAARLETAVPMAARDAQAVAAEGGRRLYGRAAWVTGAVAVACAGAATAFALKVQARNEDLAAERDNRNPADPPRGTRYRQLMAEARQAEVLEWVFVGLGSAALAGAATFHYLGRAPEARVRMAVGPWPGPGVLLSATY